MDLRLPLLMALEMKTWLGPSVSVLVAMATTALGGVTYIARQVPRIDGRIDTLSERVDGQEQLHTMTQQWLQRVESKLDRVIENKLIK